MKDSEEEADVLALKAAKTFREALVKDQVLPPLKEPEEPQEKESKVLGVHWFSNRECWRVRILVPRGSELLKSKGKKLRVNGRQVICSAGKGRYHLFGGEFKKKSEAEREALKLIEKHDLGRRVKIVPMKSQLFRSPFTATGVSWNCFRQRYHGQYKGQNLYVKPKDHSEKELQKSLKKVLAWRKKLSKAQ